MNTLRDIRRRQARTAGRIVGFCAFAIIAAVITCFAAWVQHIIYFANSSMETAKEIGLGVAGIVFAPMGVVHGWCVWFGGPWF